MTRVSCLERIIQFRIAIKQYKHMGEQREIQKTYVIELLNQGSQC